MLKTDDATTGKATRLAIIVNRGHTPQTFALPGPNWRCYPDNQPWDTALAPRSVSFCIEN